MAVDNLEAFLDSVATADRNPEDGSFGYQRVLIFVDNAGADVVLGILPLVREFLAFRPGVRSVLRATSQDSHRVLLKKTNIDIAHYLP